MQLTRREFASLSVSGVAAGLLGRVPVPRRDWPPPTAAIKALAFDAFPIFDPRPITAVAEELYPGKGDDLTREWQNRQFQYAWLRVTAERYADFWRLTQDALVFASERLQLGLSDTARERLVSAYLTLKAWPDVAPMLSAFKSRFRLVLLSNFTRHMLESNIRSAGLEGVFEHALSTDAVQTYKPAPRAYQLGLDALKLTREEILFVAHAGWDAAGAKLFGYPTYWVNRLRLPMEQLGAKPDGTGESLSQLVEYLR